VLRRPGTIFIIVKTIIMKTNEDCEELTVSIGEDRHRWLCILKISWTEVGGFAQRREKHHSEEGIGSELKQRGWNG
jgi:hypothetical protein